MDSPNDTHLRRRAFSIHPQVVSFFFKEFSFIKAYYERVQKKTVRQEALSPKKCPALLASHDLKKD
jgi:hypothetical protein